MSDARARAGMCTSTTQLVDPWYHQRLHSHTLSATRRNAWRNACSIAVASFTLSNKKPPSACCAAASRSVSLVASASRVCRKSSWCRYRDTPAPPCPSYTATCRPSSRATSWSSSMYGRWPFAACTLHRSAARASAAGCRPSGPSDRRPRPPTARCLDAKQTNHLDIRHLSRQPFSARRGRTNGHDDERRRSSTTSSDTSCCCGDRCACAR